ncbi:hypothetical protein D8S78_05785 [Natrialba swarupiae]|nr:hypothetical protein [Natrialba swarupiae]
MRLRRNGDPDPPGLEWEARKPWKAQNELTDRQTIEYDEETYFCRTRDSSDGTWRVAYGSPISGRVACVSVFERRTSLECLDRPSHRGFVSERGTVVILGGGAADDLDGACVRSMRAAQAHWRRPTRRTSPTETCLRTVRSRWFRRIRPTTEPISTI